MIASIIALEANNTKFDIGSLIRLQVVADKEVGASGDTWTISGETKQEWINTGTMMIKSEPVKVTVEGGLTKIELLGLIHSPGAVKIDSLKLTHKNSGEEIEVSATQIGQFATPEQGQEQVKPNWYIAPVHYGSWNYFLIVILLLVFLAALFFGVRAILRRMQIRVGKRLNAKEKALRAIQSIQGYTREGRSFKQEDWKKFSFQLAGIIRQFTDENFGIDTSDQTDREFLNTVAGEAAAKEFLPSLRHILTSIDEARYGKKNLDQNLATNLLQNTISYVEGTFKDKDAEKAGTNK